MADIVNGNWTHTDPGDDIPDGSTILGGNFSQLMPDTPILVGKTLTITGGNFSNVRIDPNWTITGGNWMQLSRCYHLYPEWDLPVEIDDCPHVIDIHTVTIDGVVVETIYDREDVIV